MGLFDRLTGKKPAAPAPVVTPQTEATAAIESRAAPAGRSGATISDQLASAAAKLDAKDLSGALAAYEAVLAEAGDRPDVLVSISGELGSRGHVAEIIELVAPLYDAERHGPATGLNLLQAYLAVQNTDAAQHMLDVLFALKRPELETRLYGFSNALAELLTQVRRTTASDDLAELKASFPKVSLVTVSKPIWAYGLESIASDVLPPQDGKRRHLAFVQLAVLGLPDYGAAMEQPETALSRLARGLPLWLTETFYFSPAYAPVAGVGVMTAAQQPSKPVIFGAEWNVDNLRQLVESSSDGVDYIVTGALRATADDFELVLRVYEAKGYRERKKFTARWTPSTADAELARLQTEVRRYMEWSDGGAPFAYAAPKSATAWIDTLATSLNVFLVEKAVLPPDRLPAEPELYATTAEHAVDGITASLAYLTLTHRARGLGVAVDTSAPLADAPVIAKAKTALGV